MRLTILFRLGGLARRSGLIQVQGLWPNLEIVIEKIRRQLYGSL